jgi:hypothetical protein
VSEQLTFPGMPGPAAPVSPRKESAAERLTRRQREGIPYGVHPLTYALDGTLHIHPQAAADGRTCGNCSFREVINQGTERNYPKCLSEEPPFGRRIMSGVSRLTRGSASDVRKWWPGCRDHEFGDPALGPDAARSGPATAYNQ